MGRGFLPRKCVYGSRPVSAHPFGAIQCLMLVHVGSQDCLVGTWQEQLAGTPVNYYYYLLHSLCW